MLNEPDPVCHGLERDGVALARIIHRAMEARMR